MEKEKAIEITPPAGYEIDTEKSTLSKIVFRQVDRNVTQWENFPICVEGYWVNDISKIVNHYNPISIQSNRNVWPTKELAQAALALSQLAQWRKYYLSSDNNHPDWKPDFSNTMVSCFCIDVRNNELGVHETYSVNNVLSFPSKEMAKRFKKEFSELLETAKPLL